MKIVGVKRLHTPTTVHPCDGSLPEKKCMCLDVPTEQASTNEAGSRHLTHAGSRSSHDAY